MADGKGLKDLKITPEQDKLYREWFHGKRRAVEVGKGGPILVGPLQDEKAEWFYDRQRVREDDSLRPKKPDVEK